MLNAQGDVLLLVELDRAWGTVSGAATMHLLRRAFSAYADARRSGRDLHRTAWLWHVTAY